MPSPHTACAGPGSEQHGSCNHRPAMPITTTWCKSFSSLVPIRTSRCKSRARQLPMHAMKTPPFPSALPLPRARASVRVEEVGS